ncbi:hypothetical protein HPB51_016690 [Rhipicephalus microplus]|uniref:Uncharacterized protein n=1 Tax=Rhipicephalus microplus TaxID=6941 RepID=A0A9J6D5N9_RHIMP|nr:hypothetical protein HPB51_016690 [Rhipicephalus microplus]
MHAQVRSVCWTPRHREPVLQETLQGATTPATQCSTGRLSRPQEEKTFTPTEAMEAGLSGTATRGLALYHQPYSVPSPWRGCSQAFLARPNSGRISSQGAYSEAGFARPAQPNPPSPGHKSAGQGDSSWATRIRQEPQVSGSGGAAFPSPPSMIPRPKPRTPSAPTWEQIQFRELQAQVASFTQAVEALANHSSIPTPTPSGQALEAMDSAASQHGDNVVLLAPMEARLSSLGPDEVHSDLRSGYIAATLQTVFDHIPGMIVAQLPQLALNTRQSKLKQLSNSPAFLHLSQVAAVDEQSSSLTATS